MHIRLSILVNEKQNNLLYASAFWYYKRSALSKPMLPSSKLSLLLRWWKHSRTGSYRVQTDLNAMFTSIMNYLRGLETIMFFVASSRTANLAHFARCRHVVSSLRHWFGRCCFEKNAAFDYAVVQPLSVFLIVKIIGYWQLRKTYIRLLITGRTVVQALC